MINQLEETILNCISGGTNIQAVKDVFAIFKNKSNGGIVVEIEDYDGNSIGGIRLNGFLLNNKTQEQGALSVADIDSDYLWNEQSDLIRVQLDGTLKTQAESIQEEWEFMLQNGCNGKTELFQNEEDLIMVERFETEPFHMDKHEILHMLINNEIKDFNILADNCIELIFNGDVEYLICPLCARKEVENWFKEIKSLLG